MTVAAAIPDSAPLDVAALKAAAANGNGAVPVTAAPSFCGPPPSEPPLEPSSEDYKLHLPVSEIHAHDAGTKDAWVPRHVDLIRLTGRHPFNCEPKPSRLFESYITPPSLHYVRNHGAVPQIQWEEHRLVVNGLVNKPLTFTMDDILRLPSVDVTCTLTCAGNRRKEENMMKQTIGFNWGPAGTGCSTWTGVRVCDLLQLCGMKSMAEGALHVCFRGPKGELPKGDDGSYGTSITWCKAMDPASDVILAYKQNGRLLTPDHGYPLRLIIPGFIGGRMIKWLQEITVTEVESQNYYHFHDNRVLPSHVDEALANKEGWWYKPDFIINDLNVQSAIGYPAHNEVVPLAGGTYAVRGYAYCGNGAKIIRSELSLDDGKSWRLADVTHSTPPNAYGKHWGWVWWSIDVSIAELLTCPEIICRAWDSSMNTQPNTFTWNVMGMMNNCVYRVKIHPRQTAEGGFALQFEHPTIAGPTVGGWMNRAEDAEAAAAAALAAAPVAPPPGASGAKLYTMAEVEKHDTKESAWFVSDGKVYDATPFLKEHPGGADSILLVAGTDATDEFHAIHSNKAKKMLLDYYIGDLATEEQAAAAAAAANGAAATNGLANGHANGTAAAAAAAADAGPPVALNPKKRIPFVLVEKEALSHNVRRFRFALQSPQHRFGLPVGKHVFLYAKVDGELVMRAYTPSSSDDQLGYFELVIKVYFANQHPRFPDGGKMSQYLESLSIGDSMEVKGPLGHVHYTGHGNYTLDGEPHKASHISMIAGGTGITPMYQVIQAVLKNASDTTQLRLLYANVSPDDILLREELDALAAAHPNFHVWYTVDKADEGWQFSTGFICEDMIKEQLFPAGEETICCLCGPPPMIKFACLPNLEKLGYKPEQCIQF
uniref:Nitrate reductase n=1 Tax=Chlorella vulgaris TaxID=3077 RepID=D6BJI2_CHLVU|nr:nitrate reductase [Chlorella vulgaris]